MGPARGRVARGHYETPQAGGRGWAFFHQRSVGASPGVAARPGLARGRRLPERDLASMANASQHRNVTLIFSTNGLSYIRVSRFVDEPKPSWDARRMSACILASVCSISQSSRRASAMTLGCPSRSSLQINSLCRSIRRRCSRTCFLPIAIVSLGEWKELIMGAPATLQVGVTTAE